MRAGGTVAPAIACRSSDVMMARFGDPIGRASARNAIHGTEVGRHEAGAAREAAPLFGTFCCLPSFQTIEVMASSGFDFLVFDAEHAPTSAGAGSPAADGAHQLQDGVGGAHRSAGPGAGEVLSRPRRRRADGAECRERRAGEGSRAHDALSAAGHPRRRRQHALDRLFPERRGLLRRPPTPTYA